MRTTHAPTGAESPRYTVFQLRSCRPRRLTARQWWAYFGSFGDDCFDDDDDDVPDAVGAAI